LDTLMYTLTSFQRKNTMVYEEHSWAADDIMDEVSILADDMICEDCKKKLDHPECYQRVGTMLEDIELAESLYGVAPRTWGLDPYIDALLSRMLQMALPDLDDDTPLKVWEVALLLDPHDPDAAWVHAALAQGRLEAIRGRNHLWIRAGSVKRYLAE
jgi:hypothetical protein